MMVGGIDKQIYLPYQLAQNLGFYKKYGVNVQLSTEQAGGVGAETAMVSGQVDMAGAWYVHAIDFQAKGKNVIRRRPAERGPRGTRDVRQGLRRSPRPRNGRARPSGVTDIGSGTDELTQYLAPATGLTTKEFNRAAVGAGPTFVAALQHHRIACGMTTQPTAGRGPDEGASATR